MPSEAELGLMEAEAAQLKHNTPLDNFPVSKRWVQRVRKWFDELGLAAGVEGHDVHARFRACIEQWEILCSHLPPKLAERILHIIRNGYSIKWLPEVDPSTLGSLTG